MAGELGGPPLLFWEVKIGWNASAGYTELCKHVKAPSLMDAVEKTASTVGSMANVYRDEWTHLEARQLDD